MKGKYISIFRYNRFTFGNRIISQFVVFECKYLFSIIFFYFHKSEEIQDRFHTHAFNAISIKIFGSYDEHVLNDEKTGEFSIRKRTEVVKYFPRDSYHRIGKGNGCCTLLLSGPWKKTWKERTDDGLVIYYSWNKEEI